MKVNYFLASGNTTKGFCNHFDSINVNNDTFTYVIKGGAGTGKSTFMKNIAEYFKDKGSDIEYFYCSSDPNSLDGILIKDKNVAIVDGTAPHIAEATLPGVREKIINVGEFIIPAIKKHKCEIEELLPKKKAYFDMCYSYLKSVGNMLDAEVTALKFSDKEFAQKAKDKANEILSNISLPHKKGETRSLFLSYIDTNGLTSLLNKNNFKHVISLDCESYILGFETLKQIDEKLSSKKIKHIRFLSPLNEFIEGIFLPDIDTLIFNNWVKGGLKEEKLIQSLLIKAGKCVENARTQHKKIEKFYVKNMDFEELNKLKDSIINEIESIEEK